MTNKNNHKPGHLDSSASTRRHISAIRTALRRHGPIAFASSLVLSMGAAAIVLTTFRPVYEAKAFLHVIQNPEYFQIVPERNQGKTDSKSELAPLLSEIVLRDVLADVDVQKQPSFAGNNLGIAELRRMVRYQSAGGQEHYEVVATSPYPREAVVLADKSTDAFLDFFREYRNTRLLELSESLSQEIRSKEQEIDEVNTTLATMRQAMQGKDRDQSVNDPELEFLNELRKTRTSLQADLQVLKEEQQDLEASLQKREFVIDEAVLADYVENSSEIKGIKQRLDEIELRRDKDSGTGANHPEMLELSRQAQALQNQLSTARQELKSRASETLVAEAVKAAGLELDDVNKQIRNLENRISYYDKEIGRLIDAIADVSRKGAEYDLKKSELERLGEELNRLADAESAIRLRKLSLPYQISRSSDAVIEPTEPVEKYPLKLLAITVLPALVLPLGLAFLWELRAQRVTTGDDVMNSSQYPVIGEVASLPSVPRGRKGIPPVTAKRLRLFQESVDNVSALLTIGQPQSSRVIALTSAASHEGKSTLASQMAISLARATHGRILLVDADLRSPTQHRLFDEPVQPGLSEIIEQQLDWRSAVRETRIDNLSLITAGKVKSNPRLCFSGGKWESLLKEWLTEYSHIIVDTPPVLATSESLMICRSCEGTMFCMLRDVSRADAVQRAQERLASAGVNILGSIMSGVPQGEYVNRYGTYGYHLTR